MKDGFGREIDYLRLSITPRCNLRCVYCMPDGCKEIKDTLSLADIRSICKTAVRAGIRHLRITGGEPLMRSDCAKIVSAAKEEGARHVTITTNGTLLKAYAKDIVNAGVDSVNISLDSALKERYEHITGHDLIDSVNYGIDILYNLNIPIKLNCVVLKGTDKSDIISLLKYPLDRNIDLRFIELMPIGTGKEYSPLSNNTTMSIINDIYPLSLSGYRSSGPAVYYESNMLKGKIGFISAMSGCFCKNCNRIRVTYDGFLKPCLCYGYGTDLKPFMNDHEQLYNAFRSAIQSKPERHCFNEKGASSEKRPMNLIGG